MPARHYVALGLLTTLAYAVDKTIDPPKPAPAPHPMAAVVDPGSRIVSGASARPGGCGPERLAEEAGKSLDQLYSEARKTAVPPCRGLDVPLTADLRDKLANTLGIAAGNYKVLTGKPTLAGAEAQADEAMKQLGSPNPVIDRDATIQPGIHTYTGPCRETMVRTPGLGFIYPRVICNGDSQDMPFGN